MSDVASPASTGETYEGLIKIRNDIKEQIYLKEVELHQLEKMEKKLLESLGSDSEGEEEKETDINAFDSLDQNTYFRDVRSILTGDAFKNLFSMISTQKEAQPPELFLSTKSSSDKSDEKGVLGLDCLKENLEPITFKLAVCGAKGIGKSTLLNCLYGIESKNVHDGEIKFSENVIEESNMLIKFKTIECSSREYTKLVSYSNKQHHLHLISEFKQLLTMSVEQIEDNRINCCVYLIHPQGIGMRDSDLVAIKLLSDKMNLIPVIAKSDTLSESEREEKLRKIRVILAKNEVKSLKDESGRHLVLFCTFGKYKGKNYRENQIRSLPWGNIPSEEVLDYSELRKILLRVNLQYLIQSTHLVKYHDYKQKARQLMK